MKTFNLRINFPWHDEDDIWKFKLMVPSNVTETKVADILKKEHEYLSIDGKDGIYGIYGRNPVALLDYVCKKYDWSWSDFEFDVDLTLN